MKSEYEVHIERLFETFRDLVMALDSYSSVPKSDGDTIAAIARRVDGIADFGTGAQELQLLRHLQSEVPQLTAYLDWSSVMPSDITPELRHTLLGILARGTLAGRCAGCPAIPEAAFHSIPLTDRLADYHRQLALDHSQHYVNESRRLLGLYAEFLDGVTPDHRSALAFLERFTDRTDATRATYVAYFNHFFRFLGQPALDLKIRVNQRLPQIVTDEEIELLRRAVRDKKTHRLSAEADLLLIDTLAGTGLRREELATLTSADLHFGDQPVVIVRDPKNRVDRSVPLPRSLASRLVEYLRGVSRDAPVFGLTPKGISSFIYRLARRAGLPHLHTHSVRHYYAISLYNAGVGMQEIQRLLGHKSVAVTMRYLGLRPEDLRRAVDRLEAHRSS